MAQSLKVFVDSSLFLAFIDRTDLNHLKSASIFEFLAKQRYHLFTSSIVVIQTFNALEKNLGSTISLEFLQIIIESDIQILHPGEQDFIAAYRFLKLNPNRQVSLVEIINTNLMSKHGVGSVLTFDFWHSLMGTSASNLLAI